MAKQLNVSLAFTADTSQAKKQLQDLQSALTNLLNSTNKNAPFGLTKSIQEASTLVSTLKVQLQEATNVNTGKLDLSAFNSSLQKSNLSIGQYKDALLKLGPSGAQTFSQLAQAITTAEVPLHRSNALLSEFATTLKNTARWQISSSILHGFMGSLQSAYGYAQNLNQSLNNIRIVTGYSTNEMAKFAESANKAAQALSTTTTSYTDAALIYYQQGIRDQEEIAGRTETTIKLANVSRQSAEEVSSQMTAIWNNFDNGSHSLEYYADVITALGATTASSSQEIAHGMQQFAAVAETVGLSYDYAASALATIVATTRQSESTVGNGLRTIFSRLEGLKLGDTLEDGTDLNKYSAALATIGVNIKDTIGNLKDMDTILEETASKWDTLDKAQKVAFATTVGGVRQYTNLIALLDNWDIMQENINTARNSEGTLDQQAEIYAESWEAAEKRVRAAAEDIYKSLLNDKFFIELNNGFASVLKQIGNIIEGIGGFKGVLITLGTIALNVFNKQITSSLDNLIYSITMLTEQGRQSVYKLRDDTNKELAGLFKNDKSFGGQSISAAYASQSSVQGEYLKAAQNMTEEQQKIAQILLDQHNTLIQNTIAQSNLTKEAEKEANLQQRKSINNLPKYSEDGGTNRRSMSIQQRSYLQKLKQSTTFSSAMDSAFGTASTDLDQLKKEIPDIIERINNMRNGFTSTKEMIKAFGAEGAIAFSNFAKEVEAASDDPRKVEEALNKLYEAIGKVQDKTNTAREVIEGYGEEVVANMAPAEQAARQAGEAAGRLVVENANLSGSTQNFAESLRKIPSIIDSQTASLVSFGQRLSALAMGINTIINLGKAWNNADLSFGEKMLQTMTSLSMIIPIVTTALGKDTITKIANTVATKLHKVAEDADTTSIVGNTAAVVANYLAHAPLLAIILALTAAIGALVTIVYLVNKAWNKSADNAKKTAKAAEDLKEQYNKTKESYDKLKASLEDHEKALESIKELKKGTEEWRDAIQESNEKVLELINNYPKLAAAVKRDKNGILTIDKNTSEYQDYLKQEEDNLYSTFNSSIGGQILSRNANYENNIVQASRKMSYQDSNAVQNGAYQGQGLRFVNSDQLAKAVEQYNKDNSVFKNTNELAKALNTTNTDLCAALIANKDKIAELSAELSENTTANKLAAEQLGIREFQKNNPNFNEDQIQAVSGMLGGQFESTLKEQKDYWSQSHMKFQAREEYAKSMGYTIDKSQSKNHSSGYIDNENKSQVISDDVAIEYVATQEALKKIGENAEAARVAIINLQTGAKNLGHELGDDIDSAFGVLTGTSGGKDFNFSNLTEEQFEGIKKAWKAAAGRDGKSGVTEEEFFKYFGISDEYARSKGYKSGLAMAQAFANGINNYANDVKYKNILDSLMPTAKPFDEASANYNTIISAGNKITDDNYILDDKSYQELEAAGIAVDQYFEQMADGTHLLTSSVSDFKSVVDSVANSELYTAQANQEKITGSLEAYSASGGISSLLTDQDKNNILQFSGVSPEDIANIQMIEDSMARMDAYAEKFKELGLTGDVEKINELLQQSADETQKIQDAIENSQFKDKVTDAGLDLEETIEYSKYLQRLAKNEEDAYIGADKLSKELIDNDQAAKNLSLQVQKMNKGVESLSKNWKNWSDMLQNSSKGSKEYYDALDDTREALSDLLDISEDFIDDEFVDSLANNTDSMKLMEEAAKGDGDAIDALRQKTLDNLILNLEINSKDLDNNTLLERVHGLQQMLDEMGPIEAGATIDTSGLDAGEAEFIAALNKLIVEAGMGKEAVNAMLSGMGYTANFASEPQTVKQRIQHTNKHHKIENYQQDPETGAASWDEVETVDPPTYEYIDGNVDAFAFETSEPGTTVVPKIESITKNASGSANNSSSSNKGGSGGGKGGGGGGGGGKEAKPAKKKTLTKREDEKEVDRYIKINQELAQKEHESNLLKTKLDSTSGQTAIKVMKEQLGILQQQRKLYVELAKEAENYRVKDLEKLKEDFSELSFEIDPSDGMLTNYETLLKEQTDIYNKVYKEWADKLEEAEKAYIAEWERLGEEAATEEAMKPFQDKIDKIKEDMAQPLQDAQEKYDLFKKDTDKYNEAVETARKAKEDEAAAILEEYNKELDIIAKGVELKIKVDDADLQYLEFLLKQIGEGADKALDRMSNYTKSIDDNMSKIDKYQEGLYEVLDHAGIDMEDLLDGDIDDLGSFNENDLAKIEEYRDGLIECGEQLMELRKTLLNEVSEAFDEFNSDLDRSISKIEHLKTFTETYKNLIDIVGKDVLDPTGQTTIMLAQTTYTQAESQTKALKSQLDYQLSAIEDYNRVIAELEADNANGEHNNTIKELKNQLKDAEDAYASTQEEWLSSLEETAQAAADIYEAELNQIVADFSKSISGLAGSLDDLAQQYERTKDLQDMYVDDYEKIYQLSKLNRDINKSIDETDNIRGKQRLRELQTQINELQASENEMSEYELENLRRRYELELASLQLEEAKDAKSQVRMMRDNEGNWGYVYTADETAVEEAEQNYEDKLYAMQKANTEYIESLEAEILRIEQEWADALAEIKVQDYASYEEYMAAVDACNDYYSTKLDQTYDQMNIVMDENKKLYDEDWTRYSAATGYKISEDEKFIDKFNETNLSLLTGYETTEEAIRDYHAIIGEDIDGTALKMGNSVDSVTDRMGQSYKTWYENTDEVLKLAGTSMSDFGKDINEVINGSGGIVDQTRDAEEAADEMAQEYDDKFTEIIDYAEEFAMDFDSVIEEIIEGCNRAIEAIMRLLEAMAEADDDSDFGEEEPDDYQWVNLKEGTGEYEWAYQSASTGKRKTGTFEADYTLEDGRKYRASYTSNESGILQASEENSEHNGYYGAKNVRELTETNKEAATALGKIANAMEKGVETVKNSGTAYPTNGTGKAPNGWYKDIASGASGMYTGDWGSSGKLAILHEKELVLNQEDTSNILSAVDMIHSISDTIDLNAHSASGFLSNLFGSIVPSRSQDTLEQSVTITAEFPNVQNRSEIEEAFDNLINKAAQYANRKI